MAERLVPMEMRVAAATNLILENHESVSAACLAVGLSRDSYYRYRRRFEEDSFAGLIPRSSRPLTSPGKTPDVVEELIVAKRLQLQGEGWDAGAASIGARLRREGHVVPSDRTIHRILRRHGLVVDEPRKKPRSAYKSFEHASPNACWQIDGTHWPLARGHAAVIIRVLDDFSRKSLATIAAASETTEAAWNCVALAIERHGAPAMLLSDGGAAFTSRRIRGGMSEFEARLRHAGIVPVVSSPHHPQTCGKKEREWQTLKRWLKVQNPPKNLAQLQSLLDVYDALYNHDRPHQSLNGATPDERYASAAKAHAATEPVPGPVEINVAKVTSSGAVEIGQGQRAGIGMTWAGTYVHVIRDGNTVAIMHRSQMIRFLTARPGTRYHSNKPLLSDMS